MRNTVLIVDDVEMNRDMLSDMIGEDFNIIEAGDGEEALLQIDRNAADIAAVLLDVIMPKLDGFSVLEVLGKQDYLDDFPVLIISGENDPRVEERCLSLGAYDFIRKPFSPVLVKHRLDHAIDLFKNKYHLEEVVQEQTEALVEQRDRLASTNKKLKEMNDQTIELLSNVVEARSLESGTHVKRVKYFTKLLAVKMLELYPECGLDEELIKNIGIASAMHDIGKIMISDAILNKPGSFTPEEFEQMKLHTIYGCKVLEDSKHIWNEDYYKLCYDICRSHHEKWDGNGYPDGLKGDEIPLSAQLVSVADCYDALTNDRVYKVAFAPEASIEMIQEGKCGAFNPKIMKCFEALRKEFIAAVKKTNN